MGIQLNWLNSDERVLVLTYEGQWSWDEMYAVADQAAALTVQKPYIVPRIIDFSKSAPPPLQSFVNARNVLNSLPSNTGTIYMVGGSQLIAILVSTFSKTYPSLAKHLVMASSYEQAIEMINRREAV